MVILSLSNNNALFLILKYHANFLYFKRNFPQFNVEVFNPFIAISFNIFKEHS